MKKPDLITILGPTASGKTKLAVALASQIGGEILSADSRQVYRGMDIGTGKDLSEYFAENKHIPYHLIDNADAGEEYDLFRFLTDFRRVFQEVRSRQAQPVMCGGSGLYLEAVILGYRLSEADFSEEALARIAEHSDEELIFILKKHNALHNVTDIRDRERLTRAALIALRKEHDRNYDTSTDDCLSKINHLVFGIQLPREIIRERITVRLRERLASGMIDEVEALLTSGITAERLRYYGLEYRFITDYLSGELSYVDMVKKLNTAIHQFAKRQMTWFRRMEKRNILIHWIDGNQDVREQLRSILEISGY